MTVKAVLSKVLSKVLVIAALCPVVKIKSSFLNIEELQNSKYGVEISSEPVRLNQVSSLANMLLHQVLIWSRNLCLFINYPVCSWLKEEF